MDELDGPDFCTELDPAVLRERGNELFKRGAYLKAIIAYTKSLALAAPGSSLRGLAYGNRSAVLLTLGLYNECIGDAKTALENNYPKNLIYKLKLRMAVCYKAIGKIAEADETMQEVKTLVKSLCKGMDEETKSLKLKDCTVQFENKHIPKVPKILVEYNEPPPVSYGRHPDNSCISSALEYKEDALTCGQILVASRDIEIGDVLIVENPIQYGLFHEFFQEYEKYWCYCHECFKLCLNLTPCTSCSWACYCSKTCEKVAWDKYHHVECAAKSVCLTRYSKEVNQGNLNRMDLYLFDLNFKMVAFFGLKTCVSALAANGELSDNVSPEMEALFQPHKFNLDSTMYSHRHICKQDSTVRAFVAACFPLDEKDAVKLNTFLQTSFPFATGLLDRTTEIVICKDFKSDNWNVIRNRPVGWGLYPSSAHIYPACTGNIHATFFRKTRVIRALHPIKKGEQLFTSDLISYQTNSLKEREMFHKQFIVDCKCAACIGDWKMVESQTRGTPKFLTKHMRFAHLLCDFKKMLLQCGVNGDIISSFFTKENFKVCAKIFKIYVELKQMKGEIFCTFLEGYIQFYFMSLTRKFHVSPQTGVEAAVPYITNPLTAQPHLIAKLANHLVFMMQPLTEEAVSVIKEGLMSS